MRMTFIVIVILLLVAPIQVFSDKYDILLRLLKTYQTEKETIGKISSGAVSQRGQLDSLYHMNICEHYWQILQCPKEFYVRIINANFGRKDSTTCPGANPDRRCYSPAASQTIQSMCFMKQSCTVYAWTRILGDPCPDTRKYLSVTYQCESFSGRKSWGK